MIILAVLASLFSLAWAQHQSPVIDPNKYTVCAITINSDDEKKVFQTHASRYPQKYNPVVELTDMGDQDWFKKACESKIRCDQLVVSGHFGGVFFGEKTKKSLSLKELEEAGCSKSCTGILNDPYEVFLFGCNTLSGREKDSRTPAQYLQVLLQDGIPLAQAEMVVESRYGAIGTSHKESMQRAFAGDNKQLYGFDSIGPRGIQVKGMLQNYFNKTTPDHLDKLRAKRMMNKVDMGNKQLGEAMKSFSFAQCPAGDLSSEGSKNICRLLDENVSTSEKLDLTLKLMTQDDFLAYLPYINTMTKKLKVSELQGKDKANFDLITNNQVIKGQLLNLIDKTKGFGLKLEWLRFAETFKFIDRKGVQKALAKDFMVLFKDPLTIAQRDTLCSLPKDVIHFEDSSFIKRPLTDNDAVALSCLKVSDRETVKRMMSRFEETKDMLTTVQLMNYLSAFQPKDMAASPKTLAKLKTLLKSQPRDGSAGVGLVYLAKHLPQDQDLLAALPRALNHPVEYVRFEALSAYRTLGSADPQTMESIFDMVLRDSSPKVRMNATATMFDLKPAETKYQVFFSNALIERKQTLKNQQVLIEYFKSVPPKDQTSQDNLMKYLKAKSGTPETRAEVVAILEKVQLPNYIKRDLENYKKLN